ncbi:hypothetical protein BB542_23925 [Escherichia coli]|nr:hypothetical protein BB542_23925 [Escherichia coli]
MSYLTTNGRLFLLHLTRPVTHLCFMLNKSYNTIYYYMIVSVIRGEILERGRKEKNGLPNEN